MGDSRGELGRMGGVDGRPAITPDMLWPVPKEAQVRRMDHPSVRAGGVSHPSGRARRLEYPPVHAARPEPRVIIGEGRHIVDLSDCGNRCGNGVWCQACRADIRTEALRWLRELNVLRPSAATTNLSWSRAWNREILLADH